MFSSTAASMSLLPCSSHWEALSPGPVISRVENLVEPLRPLSSTSADTWTGPSPHTVDIPNRQIGALVFALLRLRHPGLNLLLNTLTLPLETEEDFAAARRILPFLVEAAIDVVAQYAESQKGRGQEATDDHELQRGTDPREKESLLKIVVAMAASKYRYRGPEERTHAVADIESDMARLALSCDVKTIRKYLDAGAQYVESGNWPDSGKD